MGNCSVQGCDRPGRYIGTGWCQTHYHRYWRTGSLDLQPKEQRTDLTYFGAHGRVKQVFGSATKYKCVLCGADASEWAYDGTDPSERAGEANGYPVVFSVWPEFYMPLCHPCHRAKDAGARAVRRTKCTNGHELTEENTYTRPSRPGTRECRRCKTEESKARYLAKKALGI